MAQLIEHLAELTGFRDRDLLDVAVVRAIKDVLQASAVSVYRCVGEPGVQRWLTRARMGPGDPTATADPLWAEVSSLPKLEDVPARHDCLKRVEVVTVGVGPELNIFPISTEREVIGVLELQTQAPLPPADRAMVRTVLRIFGNFQDLLDHSERDPLTGLLNRQTFDAAFMKLARVPSGVHPGAAQDRRGPITESGLWLGVIDIDHFKRVNDTFGHLIGDEVLLLMSRLLRSTFRYGDRLYRYGGEEFVAMLECTAAEQATLAFERLRGVVERFVFPQVGHVTVSIGFARTNAEESPAAAFSRADKALYHAKGHGRNQVVGFDDLVRAGLAVEKKIAGDIELF